MKKRAWELSVQDRLSDDAVIAAIEAEFDYTPSKSQLASWRQAIKRLARDKLAESAKFVFLRDAENLERLVADCEAKALRSSDEDGPAWHMAAKALYERRARMWGYDQPVRHEIEHSVAEPARIIVHDEPIPEHLNLARRLNAPAPEGGGEPNGDV